jgi:hypothetical protein
MQHWVLLPLVSNCKLFGTAINSSEYSTVLVCVLCIPALVIWHANWILLPHVIFSTMASLDLPHISNFSHKRYEFRNKRYWTLKKCVLIVSTAIIWNITHCKKSSARYNHNVHKSPFKVPAIIVRFQWYFNFLDIFSENLKYLIK